jgi:hypothetical protein
MKTIQILIIITVPLVCGCHASNKQAELRELSESEALSLAVSLANEECDRKYSTAPFDTASFSIEYRYGLWRWGAVDPHGINGYSAIVTFDAKGDYREVEIFYSTDLPRFAPVRESEDDE